VRAGIEARIVDGNDCEVPIGVSGELVLRSDTPWTMSHGYHRNPEATARAWRNGWFHTGDAFRRDAEGNFFFVDRVKDAIRRRGENISSFEVEAALLADPAVLEAAAVGVPSDVGEEEVLAVVVPKLGQRIDPVALISGLAGRLPHFMVPRYVRTVDALPKTPTAKVQKHALRAEGLTTQTWDREAAGLRLRRERLKE
jgi:crotonobetaine/carnitine-CoA ligase